jgi:hypothetical protein
VIAFVTTISPGGNRATKPPQNPIRLTNSPNRFESHTCVNQLARQKRVVVLQPSGRESNDVFPYHGSLSIKAPHLRNPGLNRTPIQYDDGGRAFLIREVQTASNREGFSAAGKPILDMEGRTPAFSLKKRRLESGVIPHFPSDLVHEHNFQQLLYPDKETCCLRALSLDGPHQHKRVEPWWKAAWKRASRNSDLLLRHRKFRRETQISMLLLFNGVQCKSGDFFRSR